LRAEGHDASGRFGVAIAKQVSREPWCQFGAQDGTTSGTTAKT
jgi:hypothetical protein